MNRRTTPRDRLRLATCIQRQFDLPDPSGPGPLPEHDWEHLRKTQRWLDLARRRGWTGGLPRLERQYATRVRTLIHHLESHEHVLDHRRDRPAFPSLRDILADLTALETEFDGLTIDLRKKTFSVVTPPIVLEGIELGRFEIVVGVEGLGDPSPYEVLALDPSPATGSSNVVHPHVQHDSLCEGEGRTPLRRASAEGRVFDLCLIVHQILRTYHAGSAYVPLSLWNGRECHDCGTHASDDDTTSCRQCDHDLCLECADSCAVCQERVCSECRSPCAGCDSSVCSGCQLSCVSCGESFCRNCLSRAECEACLTHSETTAEETDDEETSLEGAVAGTPQPPAAAGLTVHAVGLGQVPVPA